jgi:hypothetical protein
MIKGKYFALPWSVIIKLAVQKGIANSIALVPGTAGCPRHPKFFR